MGQCVREQPAISRNGGEECWNRSRVVNLRDVIEDEAAAVLSLGALRVINIEHKVLLIGKIRGRESNAADWNTDEGTASRTWAYIADISRSTHRNGTRVIRACHRHIRSENTQIRRRNSWKTGNGCQTCSRRRGETTRGRCLSQRVLLPRSEKPKFVLAFPDRRATLTEPR